MSIYEKPLTLRRNTMMVLKLAFWVLLFEILFISLITSKLSFLTSKFLTLYQDDKIPPLNIWTLLTLFLNLYRIQILCALWLGLQNFSAILKVPFTCMMDLKFVLDNIEYPFISHLKVKMKLLLTAFFFLGTGIGVSLTVFLCEHLIIKYFQ